MLDECLEYLEKRWKQDTKFQYEVIIVSDGSRDCTVSVAQKYAEKYSSNKIRVLELVENRGKGGAVRLVSITVSQGVSPVQSIRTLKNQFNFFGMI